MLPGYPHVSHSAHPGVDSLTEQDETRRGGDAPSGQQRAAGRRPGRGESGALAVTGSRVTPEVISRLSSLIQILETELPADYRVETYRLLAPSLVRTPASPDDRDTGSTGAADPAEPSGSAVPAGIRGTPDIESGRLDLAAYTGVLSTTGKTLLKSLAALEIAGMQLGVNWLTPAEIERLLVDRAGARSIYRTNVSTALSQARGLADRRRRGRGYEYRLTAQGRETLHRELALAGE